MCRNEFDASHQCPQVDREVHFVVYIGDLPICPECHEIVEVQPIFVQRKDGWIIKKGDPHEVEERKSL